MLKQFYKTNIGFIVSANNLKLIYLYLFMCYVNVYIK